MGKSIKKSCTSVRVATRNLIDRYMFETVIFEIYDRSNIVFYFTRIT